MYRRVTLRMTHPMQTRVLWSLALAMLLGLGGCRWVTADHLEPYSLSVAGLYPWNDPVPPPRHRDVKDPVFYGYQSTCWRAWPQPWLPCLPPVGEGEAENATESIPPGVPQDRPSQPAEAASGGHLLDESQDVPQSIMPEEFAPPVAEPPVSDAKSAEGLEPAPLEAMPSPPKVDIPAPPSVDASNGGNGHPGKMSVNVSDTPTPEAPPLREEQRPAEEMKGGLEPPRAIESETPTEDAKPLRQPLSLNETGAKSILARHGRLSSITQTMIDASGGTVQVVGYVVPEPESEPLRAKKPGLHTDGP